MGGLQEMDAGYIVVLNTDVALTLKNRNSYIARLNLSNLEIYTEPPWFENISEEGILCWVSDAPIHERINVNIRTVMRKDAEYHTITDYWKYAVPLTPDEVVLYNKLYKQC